MADLSPLRRRMIEDMTVRNLSPATQRSYIYRSKKGKSRRRRQIHDGFLTMGRYAARYRISQWCEQTVRQA